MDGGPLYRDGDRKRSSTPPVPIPPGVQAVLKERLERLSTGSARTRTDRFALMHNESRYVTRLSKRLRLSQDESRPRRSWHMAGLYEGLGIRQSSGPVHGVGRLARRRSKVARLGHRVWYSNLVTIGLPSWLSNRRVDLRALHFRLTIQR